MEDIQHFLNWVSDSGGYLLVGCGIIGTLGAAINWIYKGLKTLIQPLESLKTVVDGLAQKNDHYDACLHNDKQQIDQIREDNKIILRCFLQLLTHEIDGNHISKMKELRDEVQAYIIDKELKS